ncbi:MAG: aminotransferase class I/II-fold pyridoxal phosphate-dependent enzyme [Oscillospiraceae bacterium]
MSYTLNDKLIHLTPYSPDMGEYRIKLDANESFINPNTKMRLKIREAVANVPMNRYPDPSATKLCKAFSNYYDLDSTCVTAGNGSDELLFLIFTCFAKSGDTVMNISPDFSMYDFYAHLAECKTIHSDKDENFEFEPSDIIKLCQAKDVKILTFSNPCNPTANGISCAKVMEIVKNVDALVVVDEAYMDFDDSSVLKKVYTHDNLLVLKTASKMMGMAALRIGFAVANQKITNALHACKSPYNVNAVSQAIATVVLEDTKFLDKCRGKIIKSRDDMYRRMRREFIGYGWDVKPTKTNFIVLKTGQDDDVFRFLKSKSILVRNMGGFLRITVGSEQENSELISALEEYAKEVLR